VALAAKVLPSFYPVRELSLSRSGEEKVALLRRVDAAARAYDSRIVRVEAGFAEGWSDVLVVSSDGTMARDRQPMVRLGVSAMAEENGKRQSGRSGTAKRRGLDLFAEPGSTPEDHGREAARLAVAMLHAQEAPAGPMEVVLAAGESGILAARSGRARPGGGFQPQEDLSNYSGQMGKQVASSLVHGGRRRHHRRRARLDQRGRRGHSGGRNVLIENGILVGYMQDRISARHFGTKPTGNGRRESFRQPPMPRMTNTLLLAGNDDPQDIIGSVVRGVYAKRFSGGQVNISNGDFVFSLTESYLIEDGKLTAPLRGVNLIGNGPEVLRNVTMVGHDFLLSDGTWTCGKDGQSVPVGIGTPTVKIAQITVGGTKAA
jgi:TldD protein